MSWERNVVIKSKAELEAMREAGRVNALALEKVRAMIAPGITTGELDAAAEELIRKQGLSGPLSFPGDSVRQY
jgi:methionyl aminopeptidase